MIDVERIRQDARLSAKEVLANEEAMRADREEREAQERAEHLARTAAFEQQKPQLQEQARQEHQARFQPLQDILDQLVEPIKAIRDTYFPNSPLIVVDHYESPYRERPIRHNDYYRALMVLDKNPLPRTPQRLLGVYIMAEESVRRGFIKLGPHKDTRYNVRVGLHEPLCSSDREYWERTLKLATRVRKDMENITPESDLFYIEQDYYEGGRIVFASSYCTAPSLKNIAYDIGRPIRFRQEPRTFAAIEARFVDVLKSRELEALRVNRRD